MGAEGSLRLPTPLEANPIPLADFRSRLHFTPCEDGSGAGRVGKGDQPWMFVRRTDVEDETPILQPPDAKS